MSAARKQHPGSLRTLVLNADGRPLPTWPLSLISAQDAVSAVWRDSVTVVENWEGAFFHSPSTKIAVPKVVMLHLYVPVTRSPKYCWRSVRLRDHYRCQYCGERFEAHELTRDHLVPRSRGGKTEWENILTACIRCNAIKGDQPVTAQNGLRPLKEPRAPTNTELLRAGLEFLGHDIREDFGLWLEP